MTVGNKNDFGDSFMKSPAESGIRPRASTPAFPRRAPGCSVFEAGDAASLPCCRTSTRNAVRGGLWHALISVAQMHGQSNLRCNTALQGKNFRKPGFLDLLQNRWFEQFATQDQ